MASETFRGTARVLAGGAILLPFVVRDRLGLRASDSLVFTAEGGAIVARKFRESEACYHTENTAGECSKVESC